MSGFLGVLGCLLLLLIPVAFLGGILYLAVWLGRRNRAAKEAGTPLPGASAALMVALGVGAVLGVILFVGVIAAVLIPNFVDALGKAKQKRTLADLRVLSRVLEDYRQVEGGYPAAENADELLSVLTGAGFVEGYTTVDGWGQPMAYRCWNPLDPGGPCTDFRLSSPGADGVFQEEGVPDSPGDGEAGPYDRDLVFGPEGILQGPGP